MLEKGDSTENERLHFPASFTVQFKMVFVLAQEKVFY